MKIIQCTHLWWRTIAAPLMRPAFEAVVSKHIPRVLGIMFHCSALLQTTSAWCSPLEVFSPFSSTISTAQIIFPSVYCGHPDVVTKDCLYLMQDPVHVSQSIGVSVKDAVLRHVDLTLLKCFVRNLIPIFHLFSSD